MEAISTVLPVAVLLGGGAYIYTQCVVSKSAKKVAPNAKSPQSKTNTAVDNDDVANEDEFLSPKQLKDRAEKEKRAKEQQKAYEQQQKKKEKEEARRVASRLAAQEAAVAEAAASKGKGGKAHQTKQQPQQQQQQPQKGTKQQQQTQQQHQRAAEDKKHAAALKKKQDAQRQKELQAKMEKQLAQQDQKNAIAAKKGGKDDKKTPAVVEDPEWTTVMSKAQRKKLAQQKSDDSDDDDDETGEVEVIQADDVALEPVKEEKITVIVPVPFEKRFVIIGTGGETIEKIREKTGCWVVVPKEEDRAKDYSKIYNNAPSNVKVEGPKSGAALAKKIILELVDKGFSPLLSGGAIVEAKITVPVEKRAIILGPAGKWLKAMQEKLEVKIIMPDRLSRDTVVRIGGSRENTNACKKAITQLLTEGYSPVTHPTWVKQGIEFDSSYRRRLIGRAGQVIKQLQSSTRCKISFPASEDKNVVYILGEPDNVQVAISRINKLVQQIEFDEEEADLQRSLGEDGEEFDEDQLQYLYIPDEDEGY